MRIRFSNDVRKRNKKGPTERPHSCTNSVRDTKEQANYGNALGEGSDKPKAYREVQMSTIERGKQSSGTLPL